MKPLHKSIEHVLNLFSEGAESAINVSTSDVMQLFLKLVQASYMADFSKSEDLSSLKRGSRTYPPCDLNFGKQEPLCNSGTSNRGPFVKTKAFVLKNKTQIEK